MKAKPILEPPTARQLEVLAVVRTLEHPNAVQVAATLGIDRMAAKRHMKALERRGLLKDVKRLVSSGKWALTEEAQALLEGKP